MDLGRDLKAAYSSWAAHVGLLTSAFGVISYLAKYLAISLSAPVEQLLRVYREVFHTPIAITAEWLGVHTTPLMIDLILVWCLFGFAVGASIGVLLTNRSPGKHAFFVTTPEGAFLNFFAGNWVGRIFLVALSIVAWPMLIIMGIRYPYVVRSTPHQAISLFNRDILDSWTNAPGQIRVICDLRVVLLVQLAALLSVVAVVLIGNLLSQ